MKELLGYVKNIPSAARHRALRWQLASIARLVGWHVYNAVGFVVYRVREVWRWRR